MKKYLLLAFLTVLSGALFSGCVVYVVPDEGYSGSPGMAQSSVSYSTAVTTVPAQVSVFYTLKIMDNRWIFYTGAEEVAFWEYFPDGRCVRHGRDIDGLVRMFYTPDSIAAEMTFRHNDRDGYYRTYWSNGKVREEGTYSGGLREGNWMDYDEAGSLSRNDSYHAGARDKVVFENKKIKKPGKSEWDWKFMDEAEHAKKFEVEPFDRNKVYPRDNGKGKRYGQDPGNKWNVREDKQQGNVNNQRDDAKDNNKSWNNNEDNQQGNVYHQDNGAVKSNDKWNDREDKQDNTYDRNTDQQNVQDETKKRDKEDFKDKKDVNPGRDFNNKGNMDNFENKGRTDNNNNAYDRKEDASPVIGNTPQPAIPVEVKKTGRSFKAKNHKVKAAPEQEAAATAVVAPADNQSAVQEQENQGNNNGKKYNAKSRKVKEQSVQTQEPQGNNGRGADDSKVPYDKVSGKHDPKDNKWQEDK